MEIILAENAGFCFGVDRAVRMTEDELSRAESRVYSYGPLIHNPQAVKALEDKGLQTVDGFEDINDGRIIVRSHGVPENIINEIEESGLHLVDCTCPYVVAVHKKVQDYNSKGYNIVIIGDKDHPEVIGINGWCENKAYIVNTSEEATELPEMEKSCVVSQTTNRLDKFLELSKIVEGKSNETILFNTICNATKLRQEAAEEVARKADAMIVIGGKHSSNTIKLAEISSRHCKNVFHIETIEELALQKLQNFNTIGITAGASTPDWIIKEAVKVMENYNKDEMMEAIESSFKRINRGDVLKGTVLYVTNNEVMVNINYKSDGIIDRSEISKEQDADPKDLFKVGDEIDVYVMKLDDGEGNVVLSAKRVDFIKDWEVLEESYKNEEILEVKVLNAVKGGLTVLVQGVNGFMPASQISMNYVSDLNQFKGQTLSAKIIDFDIQKRRMILSRKAVEKVEVEKQRAELWETIEEGKMLTGVVQRLTDFGAFVDLGGIDGLIHISDLAWFRVKHPSEVLKEGDNVEVRVLAFDKEKNRISLGLKQTTEEPWEVFLKEYKVGDVIDGEVVNILDFGAFVRVIKGVDGLLHVSQISKDHVEKPSDVLKVGDKVTVKITEINEADKKISLSAKDAVEAEEPAEDAPAVEEDAEETYEQGDFNTSVEELTKED
ncbi:bifunctional 4-hydroxy-3-methylbut-2-enyl diphosphate reductase/30S ribosomal protein S1 [Gudongella sp. SC589]|uniref:bifunctional 4-hydroxy-3-methylbut-2-enyl diphosphate reductase/30S ribosomal protein S1 n=1 Tax=Gudongella sp. SC589 TaxID=3385990 RepID=UPI0039046D44